MTTAQSIRVVRWPNNSGDYWIVRHNPGRGYSPLRKFGPTKRDRGDAEVIGRMIADDCQLDFYTADGKVEAVKL